MVEVNIPNFFTPLYVSTKNTWCVQLNVHLGQNIVKIILTTFDFHLENLKIAGVFSNVQLFYVEKQIDMWKGLLYTIMVFCIDDIFHVFQCKPINGLLYHDSCHLLYNV